MLPRKVPLKRSGFLPRKTPLKAKSTIRAASRRKPTRTYSIQAGVKTYPDGREECLVRTAAGKAEYERRTQEIAERQGYLCCFCRGPLRDTTFDHQDGRTSGHKDERLMMPDGKTWRNGCAHGWCNSKAGSVRHHWIDGNTLYVPVAVREGKENL